MWQVNDLQGLPTMRDLRKQHCMGVPEVARAMGVRENTIYRWERGINPPPLMDALRFASMFRTDASQINWWPHGWIEDRV